MTKHRFLAIGECMVELSPNQGTQDVSLGFAGDTFNTAWYAARLFDDTWSVSFFTATGQDQISEKFLSFARASGLDVSDVIKRSDRTLGLYMIHLDNGERSFTYWRDHSAARMLAASKDTLMSVMDQADVIYFSGISIAIIDEAGRQNLQDALTDARAAGKTVVFDPNLRPKLWTSPDEMRQTVTRFAKHADIVLPSFDDEQLYFGDHDIASTACRYDQSGAQLVVVKNGDKEIMIKRGTGQILIEPKPVATPLDTTAAGDSFNAGFLCAHLSGAPLEAAVSSGCDLASQVIGARGALIKTTAH